MLISSPVGNSQQTKETKTILILCALSPAQPAYQPILNGIRQILQEKYGDNFDIHTEYFELENAIDSSGIEKRFVRYNEKYRTINLDLLISVGRNGIPIIKKYAEDYLLNLPSVSMDLDFSDFGYTSDLKLYDRTALVGAKFNIDKMLSTGLSVFPETRSVYFISGTSKFDKFMLSLASGSSKKISNRKFIFMTDLSMDRIIHMVNKFPKNSLIFVPSFNTDSKLVTYHNPEAIRLISINSNAPVFAYVDMGFGDGAVGGFILSFNKVGLLSGDAAVKILKGANPNSVLATDQNYFDYVFDCRQLKRWNLVNSDLIPEGSTILFEETNLIDKYKWIGGIFLLFLVLQTLLIANLIRLNRNQKLMTKKILDTENKYSEFLHEDRSLRLGQLTASLSHELNQPLTAILSNAQAGINFVNSNEATPELLKEIFQRIVDNDKRGASIISSIRGMLKLESREKEKVSVNDLIDEVAAVYQNEANRREQLLNVSLTDEQVFVLADRIQIQQALLNLILNASQSMERAGTRTNAIIITQVIEKDNVILSVRDYGQGIDESIKEKLFKPFVTLKKEGMGIGLSICRSIIDDHAGKIWAENMPDGGAKFSFSLKIIKDE